MAICSFLGALGEVGCPQGAHDERGRRGFAACQALHAAGLAGAEVAVRRRRSRQVGDCHTNCGQQAFNIVDPPGQWPLVAGREGTPRREQAASYRRYVHDQRAELLETSWHQGRGEVFGPLRVGLGGDAFLPSRHGDPIREEGRQVWQGGSRQSAEKARILRNAARRAGMAAEHRARHELADVPDHRAHRGSARGRRGLLCHHGKGCRIGPS
mmetsp:Transcript_131021/g.379080  ORF Transcript_131021/g.379080 Transcript_131021/m.379080 type:complete len:212 (+) Transcript_131021:596-1231(+)